MNKLNCLWRDHGSSGIEKLLARTPLVRWPREHLVARSQIELLGSLEGYAWSATGNDPQFHTRKALPLPGWNMLEVAMDHDQPSVSVRLYLNLGEGFDQEQSIYLPLKSGRVTKRLFYVPKKLKAIRFDPMEQA